MATKSGYVSFYNGDSGLTGCYNNGSGSFEVAKGSALSAKTTNAYLFLKPTSIGIPVGSVITGVSIYFDYRQLTNMNAGGIGYNTTFKWRPARATSSASSGSASSVTDIGSETQIKSRLGCSTTWTNDVSYSQSIGSVTVANDTLIGAKFIADSYNVAKTYLHIRELTITVTYTEPTYTVTWKNHDGTVLETDTGVASGTTPTYNGATPTKSETAQYTYTFSGWSPSVGAISGNTTYTAQFTATLRKYTVTWKNYDGSVLETDTNVPYGTTPTYNGATPTRATDVQYTYAFKGWDKTVSAVTGNATYMAQFTATVRKYTVSTAVSPSEGGTVTGSGTYEYGSTATLTATANSGYTFSQWSDGVKTNPRPVTVTGNATYTAYFELDKINNIYVNTVQPKAIYYNANTIVFVVDGTIPSLSGSIWDTVDGFNFKVQNTVPSGMTEAKQIYVDLKKYYG